MAKKFSYYCEKYFKLYLEQIGCQKKISYLCSCNISLYNIRKVGVEISGSRNFLNIKRLSNHILEDQLLGKIIQFEIDD